MTHSFHVKNDVKVFKANSLKKIVFHVIIYHSFISWSKILIKKIRKYLAVETRKLKQNSQESESCEIQKS